jgi:hypothetical protein
MLIRAEDNFLEILVAERIPDNLPTAGDIQVKISVQSFGFSAQGLTWIDCLSLQNFVEQLRQLENKRHGSAELSSISPHEFWMKICSTDSLGHVAIFGRLSQSEQGLRYNHLLEFGFSFDPSLLPSLVKNFEVIENGTEKPIERFAVKALRDRFQSKFK